MLRNSWGSPLSVSCTNTWRIGVLVRSCAAIKPSEASWALSWSRGARPGIPNANAIEQFLRSISRLQATARSLIPGTVARTSSNFLPNPGCRFELGLHDGSHVEPREGGVDDSDLVRHLSLRAATSDRSPRRIGQRRCGRRDIDLGTPSQLYPRKLLSGANEDRDCDVERQAQNLSAPLVEQRRPFPETRLA